MKPYLIVDAHEDIAYNAFALNRDVHRSAYESRVLDDARSAQGETLPQGPATVGLPDFLQGNVRVIFGTVYVSPQGADNAQHSYSTPQEAELQAQEQLAFYALLAADPRISLITSRADLDRVVNSPMPQLGIVILMEGADPIVHPSDVPKWFDAGVRLVGPAWSQTRYSGGTGKPGPLTDLGRQLMPALSRTGIILDTSHLAEESFFEALDLFEGTVVASHSNVRALVPTDRQLSDQMIRALVARDGVIGAVFYNAFLKKGWSQQSGTKNDVTFLTVIDHIKHIADIAGDARHSGIGTDFDGGFGLEATPKEVDTVADLQKFSDYLSAANFSDTDIANIMGGNWLRILNRALPAE